MNPHKLHSFLQLLQMPDSDNSLDILRLYGIMERGVVGGFNTSTKYPCNLRVKDTSTIERGLCGHY